MADPAHETIRFSATGGPPWAERMASDVQLVCQLETARRATIEHDLRLLESASVPAECQPLDAAFYELPETVLGEYEAHRSAVHRPHTALGRILRAAQRIREQVDRVVVLGGIAALGARAVLDACCDPWFNELTRAERGCRPRINFAGDHLDNDATEGLMRLLGRARIPRNVEQRWGLVVISPAVTPLETAVAFRQFFALLEATCEGDRCQAAARVLAVTAGAGPLHARLTSVLECPDLLPFPQHVDPRYSVFSAAALLPAALAGLNVVRLLEGARAMNRHFRSAPPRENLVLQLAGICQRAEQAGATVRVLHVWPEALASLGPWYEALIAGSLGKRGRGVTPVTAVGVRGLRALAPLHWEGRDDKLLIQLAVDRCRWDPLPLGRCADDDRKDLLERRTLPELSAAAFCTAAAASGRTQRPAAEIRLPCTDEYMLGQLLQMFMLATVVESRLSGIHPYGQPALEAYDRELWAALGEDAVLAGADGGGEALRAGKNPPLDSRAPASTIIP